MLLLHGFTGSGRSWPASLLDGLAARGHLPVTPDLPGHGRNAGDVDPAHFTLDSALSAVTAAQGNAPGPVAGYSMGGRLALAYAFAHPTRVTGLVLESASAGLADEEERAARRARDEVLAGRLEREGIDSFVRDWEALPLFESQGALPPETLMAQRALRLANDPFSLACALRGLGTGALPSYWRALPTLRIPTLLLVGALDTKFVGIAQAMAEAIPRAQFTVIRGAGHAVHLERPDAWLGAVLEFLSGPAMGG